MITLTDSATTKVQELIQAEGNDELALRVAVRPGGCSGYSYEMFFDTRVHRRRHRRRARWREGRRRRGQRPAAHGRPARLQGRPPGRRVRHQQPQRHP